MLIESPELLRTWLTDHLRPLCDADPVALSKYVLALIKKDKPESELRETMVQQMDVFLQAETKNFIENLFKVVATKEYEHPEEAQDKQQADKAATEHQPSNEEEKENDEAKRNMSPSPPPSKAKDVLKEGDRKEVKKDEDESGAAPPPPEKRKSRGASPSAGGNRRVRGGARSPPRRYREYSPTRHERRPPARRRSRSRSPMRRVRSRSPPPRHRPRSMDRYRPERTSPPPPARRASSRDSTPTRDEGGYNPSVKRARCRDYDEKGFCLKGDLCKYDHGADAVVLEDSTKPNIGYIPPGNVLGDQPYVPMSIPTGGIPFPPPVIPVSVPPPGTTFVVSGGMGVKRGHDGGQITGEPPNKRFDFSRIGGRGRGRGRGGIGRGASSMVAVRSIPTEFNNITNLNAHFAKFGNLQNIQINFEGDANSALLTFSNTMEAEAAFTSSEAVLNNRFIKVFRHVDKSSIKDRLGNNGQVMVIDGEKIVKTISNDESDRIKEQKQNELIAIQKNQEMLQTKADLIKKTEEKRKEAVKQQETLIKSKQNLMEGLLEEQKGLIAKLERGKGTLKPTEKKTILTLIKELSKSIDKAKEDIQASLALSGVVTRTKQEIQKDLLDAEMELFNSQQDASQQHTQELQQKVNRLRLESAKSGFLPTSRPPRGRGGFRARGYRGAFSPRGFRGRGRGFTLSAGRSTLDRRPSRILVSGYELEEKDELIHHFETFGEIIEIIEDEATPSVILKYKTRKLAEIAMANGKNYGDRVMQLSWYNQGTPEKDQIEVQYEVEEEAVEDDYTPPQHDYLPPGLQEHEDHLSGGGSADDEAKQDNDDLLLEDDHLDHDEDLEEEEDEDGGAGFLDDDEDEDDDDDKDWKRKKGQEED